MFLFIVGILLALVGIVVALFLKEIRAFGVIALVVALVLIGISCFSSIPTGYTGILTTFGRVENETMEAGFHLKAPWQSIVKMNNQEQRKSFTLEAFSSDIQQVNVSGSINYNIDKTTAMTLYREVGTAYSDTLIIPRLYENTKAVFSHYKAEELISNRDALSDEIRDKMIDDLNSYGVNVLSSSIEDVDFTDAFTTAVEAKQVASQNKLKAETEQEQQTMEARAAAERRQIEAEAQAEVERINADAEAYRIKTQSEAEAEANKKIAESLSEQLIEYNYANSWNGQLPSTFVGDGDAIPVIQTSGEQ
jgi:regulator of protease activity HflC (stomatin/prohibitin superfamily)